jgi:integrase/recombinase XerD
MMPAVRVAIALLGKLFGLLALELSQINQQQRKFQVVGKGNKQRWCFYSEDVEIALNKYILYYRHADSRALFTAQHPTTKVITPLSCSN